MSTFVCEVSQNAPRACLLTENPYRLVSLWDIVDLFNAWGMYQVLRRLEILNDQLKSAGSLLLTPNQIEDVLKSLVFAGEQLARANFKDLSEKAKRNMLSITEPLVNTAYIAAVLGELHLDIDKELMKRKFVLIEPQRSKYAEADQLFGSLVYKAFPSARSDIREAGNCLAVGAGTAAVFHLMRAAEVALRVLAEDRNVQYPDASASSKQVGDLLSALDGKLAAMRKADAKQWPSKDSKDKQIMFYHTAVAEFRDFNEAWRKHMAHGHEGAFYDPFVATSIFNHVCNCMNTLARVISENSITPECWQTAYNQRDEATR